MPPLAPEELAHLYRQLAPALRLFARQWPDSGEDWVQEAFLQLARQSSPPTRVRPWLYRVVRNLALAAHRSASRRRQREQAVLTSELWFAATDELLDARVAVERLADLPLEQREIIVARLWGGLTFDEIARLVNCSLPTAQRRYMAGLAELRKRLDRTWTATPRLTK